MSVEQGRLTPASGNFKRIAEVATTAVILLCAVLTTFLLVRREFFPTAPGEAVPPPAAPKFFPEWKDALKAGVRVGPENALLEIVEFADFECPYCRSLEATLSAFRQRNPDDVAVVFVHFPLPSHRFAEDAAKAAECADNQGKFPEMAQHLYSKQNYFGQMQWTEFAKRAGVPSLVEFQQCIDSVEAPPRIQEGVSLGRSVGISGTPTVMVNGWLLSRPPLTEALDELLAKARKREALF